MRIVKVFVAGIAAAVFGVAGCGEDPGQPPQPSGESGQNPPATQPPGPDQQSGGMDRGSDDTQQQPEQLTPSQGSEGGN